MKIAYLTMDDPHDLSGWSGLTYFIGKSLVDAGNELSYHNGFSIKPDLLLTIKQKIYPKLSKKFIQPNRYPAINNQYTAQLVQKLGSVSRPDFLFSNSSELIAAAPTSIPKAFWVDASFAGMLGYYPEFSILHPESIKRANELEQKAYDKATVVFFASDWAADTARKNYVIDEGKIKVVPFGANLQEEPLTPLDIEKIISAKSTTTCKLLFSGVYWDRKGGPLALEIAQGLIDQGIATELIIVGCEPFTESEKPSFVRQIGFLSKKNIKEKTILDQLFKEAHFLLLPTKAECYGLVYAEANSYGMPAIGTKTGGIPTIIKDEVNGITLAPEATIETYGAFIKKYFQDQVLYQQLSISSYQEYTKRLNWGVAGKTVTTVLNDFI